MMIELWDMDVTYSLKTDCNNDGIDFVRITPNDSMAINEDHDICLTRDKCLELARTLTFLADELEH